MWARQIAMAFIGLSAGAIVAGGLFGFIVSLGVVSDFADRTHTGNKILLYEDAVALGGIIGNLIYTFQLSIFRAPILLAIFGILSGIFVGCWAIALTEILNVFPIFTRRIKLVQGISYVILGIAVGKGIGSLIYFFYRW